MPPLLNVHKIKIFISHKSEDKLLAFEVQRALERQCERIECYVSGADFTERWRERIKQELKESHLLLLLFTSPNRVWDWPLFEAGLFTDLHDAESGHPVAYFYSTGEPPGPLRDLHGVKVNRDAVSAFLKALYRSKSIVAVEHNICPDASDSDIQQKADAICDAFAQANSTAAYPTYRLLLARAEAGGGPIAADPGDKAGIPDSFVVDVEGTTEGTLGIFNLMRKAHTWAAIKSSDVQEQDWIEQLDLAYQLSLTGQVAHPTTATLRNIRTSEIYRAMITKLVRSDARVDSVSIVFVPEQVPEQVGGPLFNFLRFGTRFRYEVLEPFFKARDVLSTNRSGAMELLHRTRGAILVIEREAVELDLMNSSKLMQPFSETWQQELMSRLDAAWRSRRDTLFDAIDAERVDDAFNELDEIGKLHFTFMDLVAGRYRDRVEQSAARRGLAARPPGQSQARSPHSARTRWTWVVWVLLASAAFVGGKHWTRIEMLWKQLTG